MQQKHTLENSTGIDKLLIYSLFLSIFLPFYCTAAIIIFCALYIAIFKRGLLFLKEKGFIAFEIFIVYTVIVAALQKNWIGIACSFVFFAIVIAAVFIREHATVFVLEKALDLCCIYGVITAVFCFIERYINTVLITHDSIYRCTLYFFNCNYLATVLATVILICAYKIIFNKKYIALYIISAILIAVAIYFTGSMFVWIEILFGLAVLLFVSRKNQLLSILLLMAASTCIVIYCAPYLIPRIKIDTGNTTDNRMLIWKVALQDIKSNPLFGRGILGYYHIYKNYAGSYATTHCHNIFIDCLLNYGILGSIPLFVFLTTVVKRMFVCRNAQTKIHFTCLGIAVLVGNFIHGMTDLTFLWVQTGLFIALLVGAVGPEERLLHLNEAE